MNALNRLGRYFSNLVFQNISALIALGIIRVIFSREGWLPQPDIYRIVNPMMMDLIPILFAFSGGRLIGQQRGGVIAAFVMMGVLAGNQTDYYMILPAIIIGPVVGYAIRKMDEWMQRYIPVGFELLLNNTASAAVGVIMAVLAYRFASPLFGAFIHFLITWTGFLVSSAFLPFVALIIEPAKVFFFNNVINHGILEPLGLNDLKGTG